ncbi:MerR family transcriptional regulator [uncultured Lacinutrix sp.]|uniref:MerR family transcriptional regulator n=1 Tax=uncultured Lacinutrix sp. TaxID=574032 RepID=UPI00261A9E09|nr:MerR family transcriptional regulator [uncultured Lacinutrix sp.]
MNNIKTKFSIKDLENLSGIKAHTIRIWEKRYNLFAPNRTETNIRYYSLKSLQKLLNISFLNRNGYKVSKIAKLKAEEIPNIVNEIAEHKDKNNYYVNLFKMSMLNFDQAIFYNTFNTLTREHSFDDIFCNIFVPLLDKIGLLWQTNTITPAHEHFIVELIKQKILTSIDIAQTHLPIKQNKKIHVLFLPDNEIHEIGILYINYKLISIGFQSIYLGQSVPIDSLEYLKDYYEEITFVSSFTIKPEKDVLKTYLNEFSKKLLENTKNTFLVCGRMVELIDKTKIEPSIKVFSTTNDLLQNNYHSNQKAV